MIYIYKYNYANSIWFDNSLNIKSDYVSDLADNFYAHSFSMDFSDKSAEDIMSDWVKDMTRGTINPNIELSPEAIMSLVNTIYFYDEWTDRFDKKQTKEDIFYLEDGNEVKCDFMNATYGSHLFTKGENYTRSALKLKEQGQVIFILPDEGINPRELLATPESTRELFEGGEQTNGEVVWKIPKFDFGNKFSLKDMLSDLGVNKAFGDNADFGNITDDMAFISNISQETHISIDEKGVEAAAFTEIEYCGAAMPKDNAEMILDRPFIYAITSRGGNIIFIGICENPDLK